MHEIVEANDGESKATKHRAREREQGEEREGRWWLWGEREQRTSEGFYRRRARGARPKRSVVCATKPFLIRCERPAVPRGLAQIHAPKRFLHPA